MKVILSLLLLITHLAGCSPNLVETSRITSTDQQTVVVVANRETSATVSTSTELYLIAVGGKPEGKPIWLDLRTMPTSQYRPANAGAQNSGSKISSRH
jgi:ABC-type Fe3+-hydroxamate transport system substrate-binding protein